MGVIHRILNCTDIANCLILLLLVCRLRVTSLPILFIYLQQLLLLYIEHLTFNIQGYTKAQKITKKSFFYVIKYIIIHIALRSKNHFYKGDIIRFLFFVFFRVFETSWLNSYFLYLKIND